MRLFLAIDLPTSVKKQVEKSLVEIKNKHPHFSWVATENYHITFHFYGETDNKDKIVKRVKKALFDQPSFYLHSTNADLFINQKIVIYLNFHREKKIEELYEKLKEEFKSDFTDSKKFTPHLTLARTKISSKQQYFALKKKLQKLKIDTFFATKKITLFQSILGGKKPVYKKLEEINLF